MIYIFIYIYFVLDMSDINNNKDEKHASASEDEVEEDFDDDDDDEQEEEINILEQVQGLFSNEIFPNVIEMFKTYQSKFDLLEFLKIHQVASQYDYIRLINYIRSEVSSLVYFLKYHKYFFRNLLLKI